jgi:hypothetical protein
MDRSGRIAPASRRALLGYYTDDGKLIYAGRVGTGMSEKVLKNLRLRLDPLKRAKSPLSAPPPPQRASARRSCCRTGCVARTLDDDAKSEIRADPASRYAAISKRLATKAA